MDQTVDRVKDVSLTDDHRSAALCPPTARPEGQQMPGPTAGKPLDVELPARLPEREGGVGQVRNGNHTGMTTEHLYGAPAAAIDLNIASTERARVRVTTVNDPLLPVGRLVLPTSMGDVVVTMRPAEFDAFATAVAQAADWMRTEMGPYIADADQPASRRVVA